MIAQESYENDWHAVAVEAVGKVIEFWGFKRNQGRLWAHLYLSTAPKTAAEIQHELGMSKGAVSTLLKELDYWRVISKTRMPNKRPWVYSAEMNLREMIGRVLEERELHFIAQVSEELKIAEELAEQASIDPVILSRLKKMHVFAEGMKRALELFITGAQLDLRTALDIFKTTPANMRSRFKGKGKRK